MIYKKLTLDAVLQNQETLLNQQKEIILQMNEYFEKCKGWLDFRMFLMLKIFLT
jgi:hypothetical protein